MEDDDTNLAMLAARGDRRAFERLLTRHYDLMFRLAFRVVGTRAEAEDLAQDVCAALPAKLPGFRGEARFSTWLYRVVLNASRDRLRRRAAQDRLTADWGNVQIMHRETDAQRHSEIEWLNLTLARLTDDLRETVALVLGEEMSHAQAARVLGLSEGTVSWRMSEVRKTLKSIAAEEARFG